MRGLIPIHLLRLIVSPRDHGCDSHCSRFGTLGENWEHSQKARYASPAQKQEGCPERKPAKLSFSNRLSVCLQMFGVTREDASLSRDSPKPPKMKLWHARQLGVTSCQEVWVAAFHQVFQTTCDEGRARQRSTEANKPGMKFLSVFLAIALDENCRRYF